MMTFLHDPVDAKDLLLGRQVKILCVCVCVCIRSVKQTL